MISRKDYPALRQYTYLNTPAFGLLSEGIMEWRQEHDLDYLVGGSSMKIPAMGLLKETREALADIYGTETSRVALVPNFTLGLNLILQGVPDGNRVLLLEGDYPSLNWPFQDHGIPADTIPLGPQVEENIEKTLAGSNYSVLALSLVQWVDGLMVDPGFLQSLKEKYPGLIIVADATQYLGAFGLDFDNSGLDLVGASGYKWMLGGTGTGFFFLSQQLLASWSWPVTGFNSAKVDLDRRDRITLTDRLMPGHLDTLCFGSLLRSLEVFRDGGQQRVEAYNLELSHKVGEALFDLGVWPKAYKDRKYHGTIFNIPGDNQLFEQLTGEGILCSQRGDGIRIGFHAYNNEDDLEHLLRTLRKHL